MVVMAVATMMAMAVARIVITDPDMIAMTGTPVD